MYRFLLFLLVATLCYNCQKDPGVQPPTAPPYTLYVDNQFNALQHRFALFLSDADGKVLAFRWLMGNDTAIVELPGTTLGDRFDCTIAKITAFEAPGSGVRDTTVQLTTYTQLPSGEAIKLQDPEYRQLINFNVKFSGMSSFDSIIVPEGLTFARPLPLNGHQGQYQVYHTGALWARVQINGDPHWRFTMLRPISGSTLATEIEVSRMSTILAKPTKIKFPFVAAWKYQVDGVFDSTARRFLPLGDLRRAPGGAEVLFDELQVIEPDAGDPQISIPLPYQLYRLHANGDGGPNAYRYYIDRLYSKLPGTAPIPSFDIAPTTLADKRSVAVQCVGNFDLLSLNWSKGGTPNIQWEALVRYANGLVSYRLPDVPDALATAIPALKNHQFDKGVRVRAESYEQFSLFDAIIRQHLQNYDPLWRARAGYMGREEVY